jgi:acetyl-CoA C-acetyltransferase
MKEVVIISGVRTPVGRYMGALKTIEAYDLAALVMNAAVAKAGIAPDDVDEVIFGQSYQNGEYVNIARMGLLNAGGPKPSPASPSISAAAPVCRWCAWPPA